MNRRQRKEWLLHLWEYHNGLLPPEEAEEVDKRLASEVEAGIDSQRVRQVIGELRQAGRWETHPTFPEEMVDRILQTEGGGKGKFIVVSILILAILYFLLFRGDEEAEVGVSPEQTERLSLLAPGSTNGDGDLILDFTALEEGVEEDLTSSGQLEIRSTMNVPNATSEVPPR